MFSWWSTQNNYRNRLALGAVILLAALISAFLVLQVLAYRDFPFDSDEANHAAGSLALYLNIQAGDAAGFLREFYAQDFYPPGISWLSALTFVFFDANPSVARLFSVACLFLSMPLVLAIAWELNDKIGWLGGLIAVVLILTARPILINATLSMMEAPGLLFSLAFLWAYIRAIKAPFSRRLLMTSGLLTIVFLIKYTFGVITTATIVIAELSIFWSEWTTGEMESPITGLRQYFRTRWIFLFGPFTLAMIIWLGHPEKWAGFYGYARPLSDSEPWLSTENLVFYWRSIVLHYSPAPFFSPVLFAGLIWAALNWHLARMRPVLIYFLVGMSLIILVNHPQNPRFIATIVPAAHILVGAMIAWAWGKAKASEGWQKWVIGGLGGLLTLLTLFSIPVVTERLATIPSVLPVTYETDPNMMLIAEWIDGQVPDEDRLFFLNYWDQFSPQHYAWHLGTKEDQTARYETLLMPAALLTTADQQSVAGLINDIASSDAEYLVVLSGGPWGVPFWPDYAAGLSDSLEFQAQETFTITQFGGRKWLKNNLLRQAEWEKVKASSQNTILIEVTVYQVLPSDQ